MSYFVYILYSKKFDRFYVGQSNDIDGRLNRHNAGTEIATKHYLPWEMVWFVEKQAGAEAMILERKIKNLSKIDCLLLF